MKSLLTLIFSQGMSLIMSVTNIAVMDFQFGTIAAATNLQCQCCRVKENLKQDIIACINA